MKTFAAWLMVFAAAISADAGMVRTPKPKPDELERELREAFAENPERAARMLGVDAPHAGLSPLVIQLIIYGSIVALVMLVGIIAIIGYNLSKKGREEHRLIPP